MARDIAVTEAGDCYVAGQSGGAPPAGDALLIKTSASGEQAWVRSWDGPKGRVDTWVGVELAPTGGVVVAGMTDSTRRGDFVVARYDGAGERAWLRTWSSPGQWYDEVRDLAVSADGSAWVAGLTDRQEGDERGALVKFSAAGRQLFARSLGTPRIAAHLSAVTVDEKGDAFVVGSVTSLGSGWDLLAAKYAKDGTRRWYATARIGADSQDGLTAVALGGPGFVYACGTAGWEGPTRAAWWRRSGADAERLRGVPERRVLWQNSAGTKATRRKAAMSSYTIVNMMDIDDVTSERTPGLEGRFGRAQLDSRDLGISHWRYSPNLRPAIAHRHGAQEEAYVIVSGGGWALLDGEVLELRQWDVLRCAPAVVRSFASGPDGMEMIAIGGPKPSEASDGEMLEAAWPE